MGICMTILRNVLVWVAGAEYSKPRPLGTSKSRGFEYSAPATRCAALLFGLALLAPQQGCRAQDAAAQVATQPADATSPAASDWLDRIQQKSSQIKSLQADLRYDRNQGLVGDKQRRFGSLVFQAGPPKKYAIHFDRLLVDGRLDKQDRWYIFDGQWLVERLDAEKQFIKRQIVAPGAPADKADPLDLGEGPFALPITAKKDRILQRFSVAVIDAEKDDPVNSVHLKLTPRENFKSDYTQIDMWYDRESLLPVRVRTLDESENETVILMTKPRVNEPVDDKVFDTGEPKGDGWRIDTTPWEN